MKQLAKIICSVGVVALYVSGFADTATIDGVTWTYTVSNGEAEIYKSTYSAAIPTTTTGEIAIPATLGGYPVTKIGNYAFYRCDRLTSVKIPDSVTRIESLAFSGCTGLMMIDVDSSNEVYKSENGLLLTKDGVTLVAVPGGLTSVTIPDSVTSIGDYAFSGCSGLTSVTIPDGVTSIGWHAFSGCSGLTSVTIPDGVTSIGWYAFSGCSGLKRVTIPDSVASIGERAFEGCSGLTSIVIPESVTSIGAYAFKDCGGLISVVIPDVVIRIGNGAFSGCSGLADGNGFVIVRDVLYDYYGSATEVTIPNSVTNIGDGAFYECRGLASVTMPDCLKSVGGSAFYGCTNLTSVTIPDGVTRIGDSAFAGCRGLRSVTMAATEGIWGSTDRLSRYQFNGCYNIKSFVLSSGSRSIPKWFFSQTGLGDYITTLFVPESVTDIDYDAFERCTVMTNVYLTASPSSQYSSGYIDYSHRSAILRGLSELKSRLGLGNNASLLTVFVNPDAFSEWQSYLGSQFNVVAAPAYTVNYYVGYKAQDGSPLPYWTATEMIASPQIKTYDYRYSGTAFTFMGWGTEPNGEAVYPSGQYVNALTNEADTVVNLYRILKPISPIFTTSYGTLTSVDVNTFSDIVMPDSVRMIADGAFAGCSNLTSVTLSGNVTNIGFCAFPDCGVSNWVVPSNNTCFMEREGLLMSKDCRIVYFASSDLESVLVPRDVTNINVYAFQHCPSLTSLIVPRVVDTSELSSHCRQSAVVRYYDVIFSFDSNGGDLVDCAITNDFGCAVGELPVAERDGCVFLGWFTEPEGGEEVRPDTDMTEDMILYAHWSEKPLAPVVTPSDGTEFFGDDFEVSIGCPTRGVSIYYSTSGTPRIADRYLYTGPITISDTTTIRAIAVYGTNRSDYVSATLSRHLLTLAEATDAENVSLTTGGVAPWETKSDNTAPIAPAVARSGLMPCAEAGRTNESWMEAAFEGKGTLSFWWKVDCEEDDSGDCTWDRLMYFIDGASEDAARIDGQTEWAQVTLDFTTSGPHTVRWVYLKDDYDDETVPVGDCAWVDGIVWTPSDLLPTLGDNASDADVVPLVAKFADTRIAEQIADVAAYNEFRAWVDEKELSHEAVAASSQAWSAYALDAPAFMEKTLASEDVRIESFTPSAMNGRFDFTVGIEDVAIGSAATAERLLTVFGIEGAASLDESAFSSANMTLEAAAPENGKVKFTARPKNSVGASFFMRVKVMP